MRTTENRSTRSFKNVCVNAAGWSVSSMWESSRSKEGWSEAMPGFPATSEVGMVDTVSVTVDRNPDVLGTSVGLIEPVYYDSSHSRIVREAPER